ncbi:serine/threonine-protein kinase [Streptomyces sp. NPDC054987]
MLELTGSGAEPLEAEDPLRIGPIPLAGRLGAGGMGRVYLGVHERRYVAVKQLLPSVVGEDEGFLRRFGHELDNLARLPAGATAPLLAGDREARPPWFATAYVPGLTLSEALRLHGGPLPEDALWLLLREAAASLAPVHALDVVHRDLKPSNVMLTLDGLTLIDFGVARAAEQSRLTVTGMVVGTPAYMAPEQASGKRALSGATDVFALGSVLAYAACGRPPFGDESGHGVLYRIVHEQPDLEPLRERAPELAEIVEACLAKDPDSRPTAPELLDRASRKGPFTQPLWPAAVDERLAERAAFADNVQEIDVPTLPLSGGRPEAEAEAAGKEKEKAPGPDPAPAPGSPPDGPERGGRRERRRTRVLLAVLPVVVLSGGTTLAIQYLPHTSSPRAEAQNTPPASVTAPAQPPSSPDSGTYRYRNGNNGKCITQVFGSSDFGDCANGSARWTVRSMPDGGFKLVNQQSGSCLYSNGLGQAVFVGDCSQDIGRVWRTGSNGALRSDLGGGCLDLGMSSGLVTKTCGGEASQRWTKQT